MGVTVRPRLRWLWRKLAVAAALSGAVKLLSPAELPVAEGLLLSSSSVQVSCIVPPLSFGFWE